MFDNVFTLDNAFVSMAVGLIISFLLFWAPGIGKLWAKNEVKRLTLLGLFLGVPLAVTLLGCYTTIPIRVLVACSPAVDSTVSLTANIYGALKLGFSGLAASQGGYLALLKWAPELMHSAQKIKSFNPFEWLDTIRAGTGVAAQSEPAVTSVWDPAVDEHPNNNFTTETAHTGEAPDYIVMGGLGVSGGNSATPTEVDPTG